MQTLKIPTVLSIAGSDPSGGAGIQADLKTFMATGVYGAAVIAGLTAQNTVSVDAAEAVSAAFVEKQLKSVLGDLTIDAVKLGMLPNREICEVIAPYLKDYTVVCDPVMVATSGGQLVDRDGVAALIKSILPQSDFVTPNRFELEVLYGKPVEDMVTAGKAILSQFPEMTGIVLKGGHSTAAPDTISDILLYRQGETISEIVQTHPRIGTQNTHGTGCTFSSALAAYLARGFSQADAFARAVRLTHRLIEAAAKGKIGHGHGPLLHHGLMECTK